MNANLNDIKFTDLVERELIREEIGNHHQSIEIAMVPLGELFKWSLAIAFSVLIMFITAYHV